MYLLTKIVITRCLQWLSHTFRSKICSEQTHRAHFRKYQRTGLCRRVGKTTCCFICDPLDEERDGTSSDMKGALEEDPQCILHPLVCLFDAFGGERAHRSYGEGKKKNTKRWQLRRRKSLITTGIFLFHPPVRQHVWWFIQSSRAFKTRDQSPRL